MPKFCYELQDIARRAKALAELASDFQIIFNGQATAVTTEQLEAVAAPMADLLRLHLGDLHDALKRFDTPISQLDPTKEAPNGDA